MVILAFFCLRIAAGNDQKMDAAPRRVPLLIGPRTACLHFINFALAVYLTEVGATLGLRSRSLVGGCGEILETSRGGSGGR